MLYLVGLGLNEKGITLEGINAIENCEKVYLENYTVDFPYDIKKLEKVIKKKISPVERDFIESLKFLDEAKEKNIAILVYGSPLTATTHITIIDEAKKLGIKVKVIYSASVLDAIAETGLQLYKFGKITSMPAWEKNFEPKSFMRIVKENLSIKAHSLILIDIGLDFQDALRELEISAKEYGVEIEKIILCQSLGTEKSKIIYKDIEELKKIKDVEKPYCIIIPGELHFLEKEVLEKF